MNDQTITLTDGSSEAKLLADALHRDMYAMLSGDLRYDTLTGGGTSFAANQPSKPLTVDDILAAIEKIKAMPKNDKWVVIDPSGKVVTGTISDILPSLLAQHPLLKSSSTKPYVEGTDYV